MNPPRVGRALIRVAFALYHFSSALFTCRLARSRLFARRLPAPAPPAPVPTNLRFFAVFLLFFGADSGISSMSSPAGT